jgi:hypothetical protein
MKAREKDLYLKTELGKSELLKIDIFHENS